MLKNLKESRHGLTAGKFFNSMVKLSSSKRSSLTDNASCGTAAVDIPLKYSRRKSVQEAYWPQCKYLFICLSVCLSLPLPFLSLSLSLPLPLPLPPPPSLPQLSICLSDFLWTLSVCVNWPDRWRRLARNNCEPMCAEHCDHDTSSVTYLQTFLGDDALFRQWNVITPATSRTHALRLLRVEVIYHRTSSKITIFLVFRFVCFLLQKWIQLGHFSQVASFWFSLVGHPTWPPHTKLCYNFGNIKIFELHYFAKIMTGKPKIGNLSKMTELYPSVRKCY